MTIDTKLPESDPLIFRKDLLLSYKNDSSWSELKIIDNKIKANQTQFDLDRLAAKIFALSSNDLRKYEYLTGEDLGYKSSVLEKAKFEYSPLGMVLTNNTKIKAIKNQVLNRN